jgi:hypothetical protein
MAHAIVTPITPSQNFPPIRSSFVTAVSSMIAP